MKLTDDRNGLKITKSKRFCAIKVTHVISSIGAPLQTLGAPNTPLWIVHSGSCYSNQSVPLQNRVPRDLKLNTSTSICISDFHFCEWRSSL